eukprot:COSAG01_NODE_386_length_17742_cov_25.176654_7_plen_707_part_00
MTCPELCKRDGDDKIVPLCQHNREDWFAHRDITTLTMAAARPQNAEMIAWLLEAGCDVDAFPVFEESEWGDVNGSPALIAALEIGDIGNVRCLLEYGADVNAYGTPLSGCCDAGHSLPRPALPIATGRGEGMARLLVQHGADINAIQFPVGFIGSQYNHSGRPFCYWALAVQSGDVVWTEQLLTKYHADPNWPAGRTPGAGTHHEEQSFPLGGTVLMLAILRQDVAMVELLLSHGADPNQAEIIDDEVSAEWLCLNSQAATEPRGELELRKQFWAQYLPGRDPASVLDDRGYGCRYECPDERVEPRRRATPLSVARGSGNDAIIELLVARGATSHELNATKPFTLFTRSVLLAVAVESAGGLAAHHDKDCLFAVLTHGAFKTCRTDPIYYLRNVSDELKANKEVVSTAVAIRGQFLKVLADPLKADKELVAVAVAQDGRALKYAAKALRADKELVAVAVAHSGDALMWTSNALKYAAKALRADKELVALAVAQDGRALQYAAKALQADKELVAVAVAQSGCALQYASDELKADREVVTVAAAQGGYFNPFKYVTDRATIIAVLAQHGQALRYASDALRADEGVVLAAVGNHGAALQHAANELRDNEKVVRRAVIQDPSIQTSWWLRGSSVLGKVMEDRRIECYRPAQRLAFAKLLTQDTELSLNLDTMGKVDSFLALSRARPDSDEEEEEEEEETRRRRRRRRRRS